MQKQVCPIKSTFLVLKKAHSVFPVITVIEDTPYVLGHEM